MALIGKGMCIELPVFLVFFTLMLSGPVNVNFIIYRTCYVIMERNITECAKLGLNTTDNSTQELEKEVEPIANYINMTNDLLTAIIPCILCLFIGPWSDKTGRRRIFIITLIGYVLSYAVKTVIVAIPSMSPWYMLLQCVPVILTGGLPTFIMILFCYLIDVTRAENRGLRFGIMEGVIATSMVLGGFLSPYALNYFNYIGVHLLSMFLLLFALLLTVVFLEETVIVDENQECSLFSFTHIQEMLQTTFKQRVGYNRMIIILCIFSLVIYLLAEANSEVENLLLRAKFHWDLVKLTTYRSVRSIVGIVGTFFCIYVLHKLLRIGECWLIVASMALLAGSTFIVTFAQEDWQIYTAAGMRFMSGVVTPMARSLMSKIVPHEDIGKVFSLGVSMESFVAIAGGPLYTVIYTETLTTFPGLFDLIPFVLHLINLFSYIFIILLKQRSNAFIYVNMEQQVED